MVLALLALGLGLLAAYSRPGAKLDGSAFDALARQAGRPTESGNVVVILINESDYQSKATPLALWGMHLGPLLDKLAEAGPRAVGLDTVLPRFPLVRFVRGHDRAFFRSLKSLSRTSRLVSGYALDPAGQPIQPFVVYRKIIGLDKLGFFNLTPDPDGVCRSQTAALAGADGSTLVCFAARLAGVEPVAGTIRTPDWSRPARFKTFSLSRALAADPAEFRGKTVLIGFDFQFEDSHPTPLGPSRPGASFQAQLTESFLTGRRMIDPGGWASRAWPAVLAVLASLLLTGRPTLGRTVAAGLVVLIGLDLLTWLGFGARLVIRPTAALTAAVVFLVGRLAQGMVLVNRAFGQQVSPRVRDEVLKGGIPLDGQTKQISALFSDLRNFTPLVESTDPKEVVRILNGYFEAMSTVIQDHGGTVMQYVGDEIYAVFGAPVDQPDHPDRAVAAGLAMRAALAEYNRALAGRGKPLLDHGIGVHTGEALAAVIGGGGRVNYTLIGDSINLASRLQGLNKQFGTKFIISQATKSDLTLAVRTEPLPTVPIKGKSKEVIIFHVPDQDVP